MRDEANRTIELGKGLGECFPGWFQKNFGSSRSREEGSCAACVAPVASTREPSHCPAPHHAAVLVFCFAQKKKKCVVILRAQCIVFVYVCSYAVCMYSVYSMYLWWYGCSVCVVCMCVYRQGMHVEV